MPIQVPPARCTADLPEDLTAEHYVSELKLDGSRYVLYLGEGSDPFGRQAGNTLLSRQLSKLDGKPVDKTDNIPHITEIDYGDLAGTVLDGEVFLTDFPTTQSIMGSGAANAVAKQKAGGWLNYWAWDCPVYRGEDIRGRPLAERRKVLKKVIERMANEHVKAMPQWSENHDAIFRKVVGRGGEGLVIKDLRMAYGIGWSKMKKSFEVSCFISGFKAGNGKYEGGVGSIAISVYDDDGNAIEVGFASGFDDEQRAALSEKDIGRVVDVYAQEIGKSNRLRHPTWMRFRDDLDETDCTLKKLKEDLAKNVKAKRWRGGL